jgi:endonuclease YncB( thermonuclease family)
MPVLLAGGSLGLATVGLGARAGTKSSPDPTDAMVPALVTRVLDATTIEALIENDTTESVRLLGIAAVACYERPAIAHLTQLVKGRWGLIEMADGSRDRSGRIFGYLWLGGRLANAQLVADGVVLPLVTPASNQYGLELEVAAAQARELSLGLWSRCGMLTEPGRDEEPDQANDNRPDKTELARRRGSVDGNVPGAAVPRATQVGPVGCSRSRLGNVRLHIPLRLP